MALTWLVMRGSRARDDLERVSRATADRRCSGLRPRGPTSRVWRLACSWRLCGLARMAGLRCQRWLRTLGRGGSCVVVLVEGRCPSAPKPGEDTRGYGARPCDLPILRPGQRGQHQNPREHKLCNHMLQR